MKTIVAAAIAALLALACPVLALSELSEDTGTLIRKGLVCDTPQQIERFFALDGPSNPREVMAAVNVEAGSDTACIVGVYLAAREAVVGRIPRDGKVYGIIRMKVTHGMTPIGLVPVENAPVTWFAIELLPETDL